MQKTILCFSFVLSLLAASFSPRTPLCANAVAVNILGDYATTVPVNKTTKVYIDEDMVDFIRSTGRIVTCVAIQHTFIVTWYTYKYYYIANEFVEKVVSRRSLQNDVDTLIFMVNILENLALSYDPDCDKVDYALGYVRNMCSAYDSRTSLLWMETAGDICRGFIDFVNFQNGHGTELREYFAHFIQGSAFNSSLYGSTTVANTDMGVFLIDPVTKNNIDLIHMFASMDGIYAYTGNDSIFSVGEHNLQRDLVSWLGDLQQVTRRLFLKKGTDIDISSKLNTSDFGYIMGYLDGGCSATDIYADIDAMNLTKTFLDDGDNSISIALGAYYNTIFENEAFRFSMFIQSTSLETELLGTNLDGDVEKRFQDEIFYGLNLYIDDGIITTCSNNANLPRFKIMTGLYNGGAASMPDEDIRIFVARSFYDYCIGHSTY